MKAEDHMYASDKWEMKAGEQATADLPRHRRISHEDSLDALVDERMREVQGYISNIKPADAERICLLIDFCYQLELHQQAVSLHARLDRNAVDIDWLRRVDTIVRASRMKV